MSVKAASNTAQALCLALVLGILAGCFGSKTAEPAASHPPEPRWERAPKALEITFLSDPFLNQYDGAAHPLTVCVYQLEDAAAFRRMAATPQGLGRLADGRGPDDGVTGVTRLTVQPGRNETLLLDRTENARFVAVACGYFGQDPAASARVYAIPVDANTTGWLWWKQTSYAPARLAKKIVLGKTGVQADAEQP